MADYIVLDRDGVINVDLMTYVTKPEEFKPIPGSLDAIANLNKNGFKVFIATNQACIEREIISEAQLSDIHDYMKALLEEKGGKIDYIAFCPHAPETKCLCRKPETGLLEEIENKFNIKLQGKYFIGDKESDIIAGLNHGCEPILIQTGGYGEKVLQSNNCPPSEHCFDNLYDACEFIINKK